MKEIIKEILSVVLDVPMHELDDFSSTQTLEQWDSLNHMKIIAALEEHFSVSFTEQETLEMQSVKLIEYTISCHLSCPPE
ncbi:MAG: acyl carrier protein [Nitrospirae bacterium]|nr:acyl carrier protein [Nitrospirota bacterium]MBF0519242.1 acyl carrier protein [Nitrospirota bacterium]MBF0535774.1 acyl carrier protein [Nitrospirota bacterium]MBF0617685.1 acyl carrier protein [Nitrospirota bacterium]